MARSPILLLAAVAVVALLLIDSAAPAEWYPCSLNDRDNPTASDDSADDPLRENTMPHKMRGPYRPANNVGQSLLSPMAEPTIECIKLNVSLNWDDPSSRNITFFMKRFTPPRGAASAKGNVWVIDGGPGGAGGLINDLAYTTYAALGDEYNVYVPHHRGTGYSTRLGCPNEFRGSNCSQELKEQYGDDLHFFSTTMAVKDLAFAIGFARVGEQTNTVYGVSYGTYLLNRFLMLYPNLATKVAMDGLCPSNKCRILTYDVNANTVSELFYDYCGKDSTCYSKLGNPKTALFNVEKFLTNAKSGKYCVDKERPGYSDGDFRVAFFSLQSSELLRELWPAFVHRANRCNDDDKKALLNFFDSFMVNYKGSAPAKPRSNEPVLYSESLGNNILLSEMYNDGFPVPTCERVYGESDQGYVGIYIGYESCILRPYWNTYVPDQYHERFPSNISAPVLLINGDLDSATPLDFANLVYNKYTANGFSDVKFVIFKQGVHALGAFSQQAGSSVPCGLEVVASFIKSDTGRVDLSCLDKRIALDFVPETDRVKGYSKQYFGTEDLWGSSKQSGDALSALPNLSHVALLLVLVVFGLLGL